MGMFGDVWDSIGDFFGGSSGSTSSQDTGGSADLSSYGSDSFFSQDYGTPYDTGSSYMAEDSMVGPDESLLGDASFNFYDVFEDTEEDKGFLTGILDFAQENPVATKAMASGLGMLGKYFADSSIADKSIEGRKDLIKLQAALDKATTGTAGSPGVLRRKRGNTKKKESKPKKQLKSTPQSLLE